MFFRFIQHLMPDEPARDRWVEILAALPGNH